MPPSLERFRILAKSQGVSRYFVGALLAAWLACLTAVHFPLPRLYDFPDPRLGPRENLGFLAFSACAGLHGLAAAEQVDRLRLRSTVSPEPHREGSGHEGRDDRDVVDGLRHGEAPVVVWTWRDPRDGRGTPAG